jgi:hypothetical protein
MGQFKPMVKMETTEPSVILKLAKGGHVNMKKGGKAEAGHKKMAGGGGAMGALAGTPALIGRPAVNAPVRAPGKPSMAARRKAMLAKPAMPMGNPSMPSTPMKKGGKAEGGKADMAQDKAMIKKAFKQHDMQEHKGGKGTSLKLKSGGMNCATGGVTNGQGGYKKGGNVKKFAKGGVAGDGIINTESQGGAYRNTKMVTAEYTGKSSGKTGGVKNGNGGGYKDGGMTMVEKGGKMVPDFAADGKGKMKKGGMMGGGMMATGGVALGNGGGYKMGGKASKKSYATGGTVNSGKPVAMPQGAKKPSTPVSINQLSGTFKKGGSVTPAQGRLQKNFAAENKTAMKQAKAQSNEIYSKYGNMKMAKGGEVEDMSKGAYDAYYANEKAENESMRNMILDPIKSLGKHVMRSFDPEGYFKGDERKKLFESQSRNILADKIKADRAAKGQGAVTETERSVTVSPAGKKRGGRAC